MPEKPWKMRTIDRLIRCLVLDKLFPHDQLRPCPDQVREAAKMLGVKPIKVTRDLYTLEQARKHIYQHSDQWNDREEKRKRIQRRWDVASEIARRLCNDYQIRRARKGLEPFKLPPRKELISDIFFGREPREHADFTDDGTVPEKDPWDDFNLLSDRPESPDNPDE